MALTKVTSNVLGNDSVTNTQVGTEFTSTSALTAGATVSLDYTSAQVFTLTPNANTTITNIDKCRG